MSSGYSLLELVLLLYSELQGLNSSPKAWWQMPLSTEISCQYSYSELEINHSKNSLLLKNTHTKVI